MQDKIQNAISQLDSQSEIITSTKTEKVSLEEAFVFVAKRITEVAQKRKMWMQELENESKDYDDDRESFDNVDGVSNLIRALCNLADFEYDSDCDSDEFADSDDECQVGGECGRILH